MSTRTDGGPAFPSTNEVRFGDFSTAGHAGMTLRDRFAEKAMPELLCLDLNAPPQKRMGRDWVAEQAYAMADAMLAAREKGGAA